MARKKMQHKFIQPIMKKSVVDERWIRTFKNKIYKYMTSISKNIILINQIIQFINTVIHITEQLK